MCGYICTLRKTTAKNSQSDLSDSTILAKDIVHLFRWNLKRQIPTSKQNKFRGGTTVTSSSSKVGVRPWLPNTDQQEEYLRSQGLPSSPYMELWSYLTYSILFTSGGKRTWGGKGRGEEGGGGGLCVSYYYDLLDMLHRPNYSGASSNPWVCLRVTDENCRVAFIRIIQVLYT